MWGFSRKKFFITLGLSVVVWLVSAVIQAIVTFGKYIGTFSKGCQVTGYPIDICNFPFLKISALIIILFNILFWFWVIHLLIGFFGDSKAGQERRK